MKNLKISLIAICFSFLGGFALGAESKQPALEPIKEVFVPEGNFPVDKFWKVAVVQWNPPGSAPLNPSPDQLMKYKHDNLSLMEGFVRQAAQEEAQYIVFSEFSVIGYPDIPELPTEEMNYRNRDDIKPYVESVPGMTSQFFQILAKELGVWIQFGYAEVDRNSGRYFNVAVVVNNQGQVIAKYRKISLFELETNFLSPGTDITTFQTPAGKFGLVICADIYDPAVLNRYKNQRVDVLSLSTSWAEQNTGMDWFRRAARSTNAFVLAANQNYFPDSGVINPSGTTQSHIRQSENSIAYGYLPLK